MNNDKIYYHGEYIFKEGDLSRDIYLIKSGCVQLFQVRHAREVEIAKISAGDIFGEMAIFHQDYRSATARVIDSAVITVIPEETIQTTLDNNPLWVKALFKILAGRLKEQTNKHTEQISDYHPFKYLNALIQNKINHGENHKAIAHDLHELLLHEEYTNTLNIIGHIHNFHHGDKKNIQDAVSAFNQLNHMIKAKTDAGMTREQIAVELIKILLKPEYKELLLLIQIMQPNRQ